MPRISRLLGMGTLGVALLAGCDDEPTGVDRGPVDRPRELTPGLTSDILATRRIGLEVRATGAFRPGTPIVVTTNARAKQDASSVSYELMVVDDPTVEEVERGQTRRVGSFRGRMGRGAQQQLTATITFPRAGYYRVIATAKTDFTPGDPTVLGDSALIDLSAETLYLLVDEQGGRLTQGYEPAALGGRTPLYGSFGPFVDAQAQGGPSAQRQPGGNARAVAVGGRHVLRYLSLEDGLLHPVADAEVIGSCLNSLGQSVGSFTPVRSASDGSFTVPCSTGRYSAEVYMRNGVSTISGVGGSGTGPGFSHNSDTYLRVNNDRAAQVYRNLNRYGPLTQQRLGLPRGRVSVVVSRDATSSTSSYYNTGTDIIYLHHDAVFSEYGRFATVHEYGHAYHWVAVEPYDAPASGTYCGGGPHTVPGQHDHNCAFVEGFADFVAYWIAGDSLVNESIYSDHAVETQTWYLNQDGSKVEGAFAGFLYDLVDGIGDRDSFDNRSVIDDTRFVDGITYPGSFIVNTMRNCTLSDGTNTYTRLFASYDVVYCLENSPSAYNVALGFGYTWDSFVTVTRNAAAPAGFSADAVRRLWRANFYGQ